MKTHAPSQKPAQQKPSTVAQAIPQLAADSTMEDARAEAVTLQRLRDIGSDSPRQAQLESLQARMNASPRAQSLQTMQATAHQSATAVAQRHVADSMAVKPLQRTADEELLQGRFDTVQRMEEDGPLQRQSDGSTPARGDAPARREATPNHTGLPDQLKAGIESLSGMSMDHVAVHYNSAKPAQLQAHAYAQGSEIHVAPGQEKHLPHEAWHVVQQMQGRVSPTVQLKDGVAVNDDPGLEGEADLMGGMAVGTGAVRMHMLRDVGMSKLTPARQVPAGMPVVQNVIDPAEKPRIGALSRQAVIARMKQPPMAEEPGEIAAAWLASNLAAGSTEHMQWEALIREAGLLDESTEEFDGDEFSADRGASDADVENEVEGVEADEAATMIQQRLPGGDTNYSVGTLDDGNIIISKVNGVTAATQAIKDLAAFIVAENLHVGRKIFLAQKFNTAVGSNHAEMCLMAAAKKLGKTLLTIYCSGPHCAFCGAMMTTAGITLGNSSGAADQMGWAHPFVPLNYGQQTGQTAKQLEELKKLPIEPEQNAIKYGTWSLQRPDGKYQEWF